MTLSRYLIAACAVGLIAFFFVAAWLDSRIRASLLAEVARSSSWFVEDHIRSVVQELETSNTLSDQAKSRLAELITTSMLGRRLVDIKIWDLEKRIAFSGHAPDIGTKPPSTARLDGALNGTITSQFDDHHDLESSPQRKDGVRILEVYFPIHDLKNNRTIAVAELYLDAAELIDELWSARWQSGLIIGLVNFLFFSIIIGIAWHGRNITTMQRRELDQKVEAETKLVAQNSHLAQRVLEAQHRIVDLTDRILMHVGSDLHDGPAQLLSVALLRLGEVSTTDASESGLAKRDLERVDAARVMTQDALSELRHIAKGLILPQLEDLHTADIVKMAVANHKRRTLTDVKLELSIHGREFPLAIKRCLFRCIQEGLNNAFRHAGGREQFVRVLAEQERVVLTILDAGPGLDRPQVGQRSALGIAGLRNRVEVLGGRFNIKSSAGEGTEITVELPLVRQT